MRLKSIGQAKIAFWEMRMLEDTQAMSDCANMFCTERIAVHDCANKQHRISGGAYALYIYIAV